MLSTKKVMLGMIGTQESVTVAEMPRSTFIELVRGAVARMDDGEHGDDILTEVMPVAETMESFPLSTWINPARGCGCVIGEYLIASDLMRDRLKIVDEFNNGLFSIRRELNKRLGDELADAMYMFGAAIDTEVKTWVRNHVEDGWSTTAVVFTD